MLSHELEPEGEKTASRDFMQVYTKLWGSEGSCEIQFPTRLEKNLSEIKSFAPVEVARRICAIKINSAAGPDGLVKRDLKKSHAPLIIQNCLWHLPNSDGKTGRRLLLSPIRTGKTLPTGVPSPLPLY